jgi:hypothetical protein
VCRKCLLQVCCLTHPLQLFFFFWKCVVSHLVMNVRRGGHPVGSHSHVSVPRHMSVMTFSCSAVLVHIIDILPPPPRYSSLWALASWTICLHSSLFFIFPPHPFTFILRRSSCTPFNHLSPFADVDFHSIRLSKANCLVSEQFSFYGVRLASRPTPSLEDQGIPLRLAPTPWPVWHGWPYQ